MEKWKLDKSYYFKLLKLVYNIKYNKDILLFEELVNLADKETKTIHLSVNLRETLREKTNMNKPNFSASLKRLTETELLSGEKGSYSINSKVLLDLEIINYIEISLK